MKKLSLIIALISISLISFSGCKSKTVVRRLPSASEMDGKETKTAKLDGVTYRLPQTVVKASIPVKMNVSAPGKYSDYTPCFFDTDEISNRVMEKSTKVSVSAPTFTSFGEPDPEQTFVVKTKGGYFENKTLLMEYSRNGTLTKAEAESKDESLDLALTVVKTAVGIGAKVATAGILGGRNPASEGFFKDNSDPKNNDPGKEAVAPSFTICYQKGFDDQASIYDQQLKSLQETKKTLIDSKEIKKIDEQINQKAIENNAAIRRRNAAQNKVAQFKAAGSLDVAVLKQEYDKAAKEFKKLQDLKSSRESLEKDLSNIAPDVYSKRIAEIDKQIEASVATFFGEKKDIDWTGEFAYLPTGRTSSKIVFFYSKTGGICTNGVFGQSLLRSRAVVPKDLRYTECKLNEANLMQVQLMADRNSDDDTFLRQVAYAANLSKKSKEQGWFYRIPARATIAMVECAGTGNECPKEFDNTFKSEEMMIAQLGSVVSIPASAAGRSNTSKLELDEATGALKNFKVSSNSAIDKSMIETVDKTAQTMIDAKDPLAKKKRELELLETENKINDEKKKLSNTNTSTENP